MCTRGSNWALLGGPSTSPLDVALAFINKFVRFVAILNRLFGAVALLAGIYFFSAALIYRGGVLPGVTGLLFIGIGILGLRGRVRSPVQGSLILLAISASLLLPLFTAWEAWRAYTLLAFCKEARVGMPLPDLLRLERSHWIDDSYLVEARFHDFVDQAHSHNLGFRSHMLDPDFECAIGHDGAFVTSVQLLQ